MYLLLVEDDLPLGNTLMKLLRERYRVHWTRNLTSARSHVDTAEYDAVLLDIGLPDGDGIEWLRSMRNRGWQTPVLILSARDSLDDRIRGLDTGADDYLVKPFEKEELLARIRVLLRRMAGSGHEVLTVGDLHYSVEKQQFYLCDEPLALPQMESQILAVLMQSGERPVSRERLTQQLYGIGGGTDSNTLDVHIHTLRKRIGKDRIQTLRGFGYRLAAE